jgi:hypothetical protein
VGTIKGATKRACSRRSRPRTSTRA